MTEPDPTAQPALPDDWRSHAAMRKHSVSIAGHRTSYTLEDGFQYELKFAAARRGISLSQLIGRIDRDRGGEINLSSALRLFVLSELRMAASKGSED